MKLSRTFLGDGLELPRPPIPIYLNVDHVLSQPLAYTLAHIRNYQHIFSRGKLIIVIFSRDQPVDLLPRILL